MSRVAEHIAELTGFRDRDLLDFSLVASLKDLLRPRSLAIHRVVGEPGQQHWITRARVSDDDNASAVDSLWAELDELPLLDDMPAHARCLAEGAMVLVPGAPALALFPLSTDRETVGVLEVAADGPLDADAQRLVRSILRIYRNFQGLLDYSERDTLTGLLNRKTFDECFLRAANPGSGRASDDDPGRRARPPRLAYLGVLDIDHFKRVNDSYGHLIGDEVLLLLSRLMRSTFRHHDQLFRFGGEEFVVLLRCAGPADALAAFERLRSAVERYAFPRVGRITVSIGLTEIRPGDTPTGCFERADKAVYFAKQNGRNQLHDHGTLVAAGKLVDESRASDVELF
jgi:diguanylate cyclase (GGDEF)-like protein